MATFRISRIAPTISAVDKTRNMEHSGTSRNTKKKRNKNKGENENKIRVNIFEKMKKKLI